MKTGRNVKKIGSGYTFIDLFAGIGGFHRAFHNLGAECVFASEWDENARKTYERNYKRISPQLFKNEKFYGDIYSIKDIKKEVPKFNILTGGFPCQPFSHAGHRKGFDDTRGTLFFKIEEIIRIKKPEAFFIENVRGLLNHDNGNTFAVIKKTIEEDLKYSFYPEIIKASDFGLPQHRPRLFMVGFRDKKIKFKYPDPTGLKKTMSDIWGGKCNREIGFTLRCGGRGSGLHDRRNWDTYLVDGKVRRLTSVEGTKMMGFPSGFKFPVSEAQAMKQLGNAVAVPAIQAVAKAIIETLNAYDKRK